MDAIRSIIKGVWGEIIYDPLMHLVDKDAIDSMKGCRKSFLSAYFTRQLK